jgi:hypothetical protein
MGAQQHWSKAATGMKNSGRDDDEKEVPTQKWGNM